ncbi:MAG TPA: hypothetical protein DEA08_14885 [Planctomycetes bacterium]|nr:hypothetical protein [Planctomycetota bacterium]
MGVQGRQARPTSVSFRPVNETAPTPPRPPALFTLNGVGTTLYGARDHRPDASYVRTYFLVVLFIPVLALKAYRVVDAPGGGWFFVGRERLSGICKGFNALVLGAILLFAAGVAFAPSPGEQKLSRGRAHLAAQRWAAGVRELGGLLRSREQGEAARAALSAAISGPLRQAPSGAAAEALTLLASVPAAHDLFDTAQDEAWVQLVLERCAKEEGALALLDALEPLAKEEVAEAREPALQAALKRDPQDLATAGRLALLYEEREQPERCLELLAPLEEGLKQEAGEGARILGNLLVAQAPERGIALWAPYVKRHLPAAQKAEQEFDQAVKRASDSTLQRLDSGKGPPAFYKAYKAAQSEPEKQQLVRDHVNEAIRKDPGVKAAGERLSEANRVVPVALELGILRLERAQGLGGEERQRALTEIEQLFLSIQATAGRTTAFKLNLAKVRYWLGKPAEGRALLDGVLEEGQRAPQLLLEVAHILRLVGDLSAARQLAEECYEATKEAEGEEQQLRYGAASLCSILSSNLDDKLTWLERNDPQDTAAQAALAMGKGQQAAHQSKREEAARWLKKAVAHYAELPESAAVLNNSAIALYGLWEVTGEQEHLDRYVERILEAEKRQPRDTVLLDNAAGALTTQAALRQLKGQLDVAGARASPGGGLLRYLARDGEQLAVLQQAYLKDPSLIEARKRLERLLLLAPRSAGPAAELAGIVNLEREPEPTQALIDHLDRVELDRGTYREQMLSAYRGEPSLTAAEHKDELADRDRILARLADATPATRALALDQRVRSALEGAAYGYPCDLPQAIEQAEQAYSLAPSLMTASLRNRAWALRAVRRVGKEQAALEQAYQKTRRALTPGYVLAGALRGEGELAQSLAQDSDVQQIARTLADLAERFPRHARSWWLPYLRLVGKAEPVAKRLREDPLALGERELELRINPLGAETLQEAIWFFELREDAARAQQLREQAQADQVPLLD